MSRNAQNIREAANRRGNRGISGPTSALTDYLAANNISATRIANNARNRQQQTVTQTATAVTTTVTVASQSTGRNAATRASGSGTPSRNSNLPRALTNPSSIVGLAKNVKSQVYMKKLTKAEMKAIEYYKTTDEFEEAKGYYKGEAKDDDTLARMFYFASQKSVGQFENCAECGKRFTVTNYTCAGPDGGLLCNACAKELEREDEGPRKKKQKVVSGDAIGRRRKTQSRILDGIAPKGAKPLVSICIEHLSDNIQLAEELGALPEHVIDRIARILSKRRRLNPTTLKLFLQPDTQRLKIYDASSLGHEDMLSIFRLLPDLKELKVKYAIQFNNAVVDFAISRREINLESLDLHGANLITESRWTAYLHEKGEHLTSLRVAMTGDSFTDETVKTVAERCPRLRRLKMIYSARVTADCFPDIQSLPELEHLSLKLTTPVPNPRYVALLDAVGARLQTFSLDNTTPNVQTTRSDVSGTAAAATTAGLNDTVLDALRRNCRVLSKLRVTNSEHLTDDAFTRLFGGGWANPPLRFVDLNKCCYVNSLRPRENPDELGLCGRGFEALMAHSGSRIRRLSVAGCRHIPAASLVAVFAGDRIYPELEGLDLSFCSEVSDFVVGSILRRSCPALRWVKVFGCMKVREVECPASKVVIGIPNALGMQTDGLS